VYLHRNLAVRTLLQRIRVGSIRSGDAAEADQEPAIASSVDRFEGVPEHLQGAPEHWLELVRGAGDLHWIRAGVVSPSREERARQTRGGISSEFVDAPLGCGQKKINPEEFDEGSTDAPHPVARDGSSQFESEASQDSHIVERNTKGGDHSRSRGENSKTAISVSASYLPEQIAANEDAPLPDTRTVKCGISVEPSQTSKAEPRNLPPSYPVTESSQMTESEASAGHDVEVVPPERPAQIPALANSLGQELPLVVPNDQRSLSASKWADIPQRAASQPEFSRELGGPSTFESAIDEGRTLRPDQNPVPRESRVTARNQDLRSTTNIVDSSWWPELPNEDHDPHEFDIFNQLRASQRTDRILKEQEGMSWRG